MALLSDSNITIISSDFTHNDAVDAGGVISLQQSYITAHLLHQQHQIVEELSMHIIAHLCSKIANL